MFTMMNATKNSCNLRLIQLYGFQIYKYTIELNIFIISSQMKLKINKLLPYAEQSKKYKTSTVSINNKTYYLSPNPLDKNNSVGIVIPLQFICTMPDQNSDYEYLKCNIRVENNDYKEIIGKTEYYFKDIKRGDGKRDFLFQFVPPYRGGYSIQFEMLYKQKYFIQTTQPPPEIREASVIQLNAEDPYEVEQNIVYEQKTGSVSFPLFVQYVITNKHRDLFLELQMDFASEHFNYRFLNNQKSIKIGGGQTYYAMIEIFQKPEVNLFDILFSQNGLMIGSFLLFQGKNRNEKKLFLKQGYKHLLFRGQTIDKKVVKKDIVEVKIKFINIYGNDYKIGPIRVSINQNELPPGVKLLKISRDVIDLVKNREEIITLTMICLRSGFFQFKGIVLGIKDKNNPKEERILKYINDLTLIVENEKQTKTNQIMERTSTIIVDTLI